MIKHHAHHLLVGFSLAISPLLSANPVITEFVASNDGSHLDEDGAASDWIEIRNGGHSTVNLSNWKLTDNATEPSKWTFPDVTLQPGELIVVFASGKNRSTAGSELHTNFSLSQSGEYLALISPEGTPTTEFSPSYPPQESGSSYGSSTPSNEITLITENDACKAWVPDSAYDTLVGNTWRTNTPAFDDSGWLSGTQGVGYDERSGYDSDIGLDVETEMNNVNPSVYIRIPITTSIDPANILSLTLRAKFEDGFAAFVNGTAPANASSFAPNPLSWNSATEGGNSPESLAGTFQDFDISDTIPQLVAGNNNMLAIQGINASSGSSDYLFRCELVAQVADTGATTTGYFDTPTPGTVNGNTTFLGFLGDTSFELGRGFYSAGFTETISCNDPGATIIYTLDGSMPTLSNGTQVPANDEFSFPTASVPVTTTTTLRAIAVKTGYRSTNVDTQTYLFTANVLVQDGAGLPSYERTGGNDHNFRGPAVWSYEMDPDIVNDPRYSDLQNDLLSLPSISVVLPVEDMWGPTGIHRNQTSEGSAWERECSVEVINPDGRPGYQVNGGIRMQGSGSRARQIGKKSMRLIFRKNYGATRFKYPLWGATGPTEVANIVLRGSYFDSWTVAGVDNGDTASRTVALQFRTHYATVAHARTGNLTVASNWVHLYINGQYWGPYNTHERPDGEFAQYHNGGDEDDYTVIKTRGELIQGDKVAWNALIALCNPYSAANHQAILSQIDQDQFIDYFFMNIWGGNKDWPHNNWYVHRNKTLDGPFIFYVWDPEHYIFNTNENRTGVNDNDSPGIIYDRLRKDLEFQVRFGDRVHKHMFNDGPYTLANMQDLWQEIANELEPAMNCESARWGDEQSWGDQESLPAFNTIDHWLPQVAYRKDTYMPTRHNLVLNQLRSRSLYPDTAAPVFSQHGGFIISGYPLTITNPDDVGTLYYTLDGSDPRLAGGAVSGTAQTYSSAVPLTPGVQGLTVKARIKNTDGEWSALNEAEFTLGETPNTSTLVISEFNYNPADPSTDETNAGFTDNDDFEFIELLNTGSSTLDVRTLVFDNNIEGIEFDFASVANPLLAPGARIVLAKNSAAYAFRYGNSNNVAGNYSGKLSNSGETITLLQNGSTMISFTYDDSYPWPDSADGQGASLVLINPMSNPVHDQADNWRASGITNGTPEGEETLPDMPANLLADTDNNGRADLIDYIIKRRPQLAISTVGLDNFPTITFTIDPQAEGARVIVQYSEDLTNWSSASTEVELVSETFNGDGTITYQWQALTARSNDLRQFMRVKVEER